ncbi:MAG: hypothetical protein EU529_02475 [Promethearchaeota archaeon]|nr:MAG: hypothetical protein EU529_02475 [Candidatus Lokiarchaeota archaeon]
MISKKTAFLSIIILTLIPFSGINYYIFGDTNLTPTNVVADDVPDIDLSELPQIDYYSLNYNWYNPKIEMLIIVPEGKPDFYEAVKPLMEWKNEKGVKTVILNVSSNAEEIRNKIKYYYERDNIRWVLLCGDIKDDSNDDLIPIRYVYNPDPSGEPDNKPTDFYYADLTGSWDNNNNGKWGESPIYTGGIDEIDWTPEVYVGRLPANDAYELELMVNKTLKYETDPFIGEWMNRMLLAGGISDPSPTNLNDYEDEGRLTQYIWQQYTHFFMNFTHLCDYTGKYYPSEPSKFIPIEPFEDLTQAKVSQNMTAGYSTVIMAGHGDNYDVYSRLSPTKVTMYDTNDAENCGNINMPSLVYLDACETASYDKNDNNLAEILINVSNAGAIGVVGALRITFYYDDDTYLEKLNRGNAKLFWEEFFQNKKFQQGRALYDSKVAYMNSDYFERGEATMNEEWQRKNVLTYCLLGDPEVDIYTGVPINASNPFKGNFFEAQMVSTVIKNDNGIAVPYARVHLRTEDGKYYTAYADINGKVNFRLPAQAGEKYNVTITGHNLIPSYFNFSTLPDNLVPEISDEDCSPDEPTVYDDVCFEVNAYDLQSGLESVFLLQSEDDDDFDEYSYYRMLNSFRGDEDNLFKHTIHNLDPGKYSFLIVARDWADNYHILDDDSFEFTIPTPMMDYILITMSIAIISITGISIFITYKGYKNYKYKLLHSRNDSF